MLLTFLNTLATIISVISLLIVTYGARWFRCASCAMR